MRALEMYNADVGLVHENCEKLYDAESKYQRVEWYRSPTHGAMLYLGGMMMCTELDEHFYHECLTHSAATRVKALDDTLIIGGGDGGTARELLRYGGNVTQVEIDGDVVETSKTFMPQTAVAYGHPKMTLHVDDGFAWIKKNKQKYDLIVMDSSEPDDGTNIPLFTEEFFRNIGKRLKPGGLFSMQVGSAIYRKDIVREVAGRLRAAFPSVTFYSGPTPTYPGGSWIFAICSKSKKLPKARRPLPEGLKFLDHPDTLVKNGGLRWVQELA